MYFPKQMIRVGFSAIKRRNHQLAKLNRQILEKTAVSRQFTGAYPSHAFTGRLEKMWIRPWLVILFVVTNGRLIILGEGRLDQLSKSLSGYVLSTDNPRLLYSRLRKYVSNTAGCNKLAFNDFESWRFRVAVEDFFRTWFCRVTIQNDFVLAFVRYENQVSEWTAVSCDAAVETDFRSAIGARRYAIRQQTCAEVRYTIVDLRLVGGLSM